MVFSSIAFLVGFLPLVLIIYYCLPTTKTKNLFLLLASLLFYAWGEPKYILLMLCSILINYIIGVLLGKTRPKIQQKIILTLGILTNISFLYYFKYFDFSLKIINKLLAFSSIADLPLKNILLPIGISFYTFHSISYLVDVYRRPELVQKNILSLGLYITFFPQLIAGPIIRYHEIREQIAGRTHSRDEFVLGIERFVIGLAKKVLIANTVGEIADMIFTLPFQSVNTFYAWVGILAYTLQIYYDFSGYSDMAIGLAKMFGFKFAENFNYPYIASSITDFWRRWHISLSSWFKNYLYIPLGGNRKGTTRTIINLMIVFICTGVWHGAFFNFLFWGLAHGFFLSMEKIVNKVVHFKTNLFTRAMSHIYTMSVVVLLWVLFRTGTKDSIKIILKLFGINYTAFTGAYVKIANEPYLNLIVDFRFWLFFIIGIVFAVPWWKKIKSESLSLLMDKYFIRYAILLGLYILSFIIITNSVYNPFIYFRF